MKQLIICALMYLGVGFVVAFDAAMQNLHWIEINDPDEETCEKLGEIMFTWPVWLFKRDE